MSIKLLFLAVFIAAASAQVPDLGGVTGGLPDTSGLTGSLPVALPIGGGGSGGEDSTTEAASSGFFNRLGNRVGYKRN